MDLKSRDTELQQVRQSAESRVCRLEARLRKNQTIVDRQHGFRKLNQSLADTEAALARCQAERDELQADFNMATEQLQEQAEQLSEALHEANHAKREMVRIASSFQREQQLLEPQLRR